MACGFDKGLIAAKYDGEMTPEERLLVERHLATCAECAADLSSMRELSASLKPLRGAAAPMSIAEGVMREIGSSRRVRRPWVSWSVSVAAAALVAVGTVYMLDRRSAPERGQVTARTEAHAAKPANQPLESKSPAKESQRRTQIEPAKEPRREEPAADSGLAPKPATPNPAPPPPPSTPGAADAKPAARPAQASTPDEEGKGVVLRDKEEPDAKKDDSSKMALDTKKKPVTPVLRIASADEAAARAEVESFLKERKLKTRPAAESLLGRSKIVRLRYVHVDLSEEELKALRERLAGLKGTDVTDGSFEAEKKRVAEEEKKLKVTLGARAGEDDKDSPKLETEDKAEKEEAATPKPQSTPDRSREIIEDKPERKQVVLVFDPPPAKK